VLSVLARHVPAGHLARDVESVTEKRCTGCSEWLPLEEFPHNRRMYLGRSSRCRECHRVATKDWRDRNRKRVNAGTSGRLSRSASAYERDCVHCGRPFAGRPMRSSALPSAAGCGSSSSDAASIGALPSARQHRPSPLPLSVGRTGNRTRPWFRLVQPCDRWCLPRLTVPNYIKPPQEPRAIFAELHARTPSDNGWCGTAGGMANSSSPSCALGVRAKPTS
jgi:hypothetical protein